MEMQTALAIKCVSDLKPIWPALENSVAPNSQPDLCRDSLTIITNRQRLMTYNYNVVFTYSLINMKLRFTRRSTGKSTVLFVVIAALAIGVGLFTQIAFKQGQQPGSFENLILLPKSKPLGEVNFVTHDGRQFNHQNLQGRWSLLFFAFTNCPDICPSTLHLLKQVKRELVANKTWPAFQVAMVTVDPERDSSERLKQYVPFFDQEFIGLRNDSVSYTTEFAKNLGVLFFKGKTLENGGYDVDHSAAIILINPAGEYAGVLSAPHTKENLTNDLQKLGRFAIDSEQITAPSKHQALNSARATTQKGDQIVTSQLRFEEAWVRPTPPNAPSMAAYVKITNQGLEDVTIVDAESPLFDMTMIHRTALKDGVASMEHIDGLTIKAGSTAILKPLGTHIMLMRPENPLPVGAQVPIRLSLDNGEIVDVSIEVREDPSEQP